MTSDETVKLVISLQENISDQFDQSYEAPSIAFRSHEKRPFYVVHLGGGSSDAQAEGPSVPREELPPTIGVG